MDICTIKGKCILPTLRNPARYKERFQSRSRNYSNKSEIRYSIYKTDLQETCKRTPSPQLNLPYREINSIFEQPSYSDPYSSLKFSAANEKTKSGTLTSIKIKHKINFAAPIKLIGTFKDFSKSIINKSATNENKRKIEIACQSDFE